MIIKRKQIFTIVIVLLATKYCTSPSLFNAQGIVNVIILVDIP